MHNCLDARMANAVSSHLARRQRTLSWRDWAHLGSLHLDFLSVLENLQLGLSGIQLDAAFGFVIQQHESVCHKAIRKRSDVLF